MHANMCKGVPCTTSKVCGLGFPLQHQGGALGYQLGILQCNSVLTLSTRDSVRFRRLRTQSHEIAFHLRCQSHTHFFICASAQLATDYKFQQPNSWVVG